MLIWRRGHLTGGPEPDENDVTLGFIMSEQMKKANNHNRISLILLRLDSCFLSFTCCYHRYTRSMARTKTKAM